MVAELETVDTAELVATKDADVDNMRLAWTSVVEAVTDCKDAEENLATDNVGEVFTRFSWLSDEDAELSWDDIAELLATGEIVRLLLLVLDRLDIGVLLDSCGPNTLLLLELDSCSCEEVEVAGDGETVLRVERDMIVVDWS